MPLFLVYPRRVAAPPSAPVLTACVFTTSLPGQRAIRPKNFGLSPKFTMLDYARMCTRRWHAHDTFLFAKAPKSRKTANARPRGARRRPLCERCQIHRPSDRVLCIWGCGRLIGLGGEPRCLLAKFPAVMSRRTPYGRIGLCGDCALPGPSSLIVAPRRSWISST